MDDVVRVSLSNGGEALVDAVDWTSVKNFHSQRLGEFLIRPSDRTWRRRDHHCSTRVVNTCTRGGVQFDVALHRLILESRLDQLVDHIDGDPLNNRRINLRYASVAENVRNRRRHSEKQSSRFKGVYPLARGRWFASICKDYQSHRIGEYATEEEGARAYDAAALRLFGEFARLNFPLEVPA